MLLPILIRNQIAPKILIILDHGENQSKKGEIQKRHKILLEIFLIHKDLLFHKVEMNKEVLHIRVRVILNKSLTKLVMGDLVDYKERIILILKMKIDLI